jgi:hypothetical protein
MKPKQKGRVATPFLVISAASLEVSGTLRMSAVTVDFNRTAGSFA